MLFIVATSPPASPVSVPSVFSAIFEILFMLGAFVLVVFLAYYATKVIGRAKFGIKKDGSVSVIENRAVSPNSSLMVVTVGKKAFLLGMTKENISMLADVTGEISVPEAVESVPQPPFRSFMEKYLRKKNDD
jgi:flagellar biogenesis protein FliO